MEWIPTHNSDRFPFAIQQGGPFVSPIYLHAKTAAAASNFILPVLFPPLASDRHEQTSGIHEGYRLVSIYDLPDSKPFGYFGVNFGHLKSEVFHWGGGLVFWSNFGHLKSEVFHFRGGGGYFRVNFGHLKSEVFHGGGDFGVNFGHLKSGGGGALRSEIPERGFLENLDTNFTI